MKAFFLLILVLFLAGAWTVISQVRSIQGCYAANTERYEEISFKRQSSSWDEIKVCEERVYALEELKQCLQKVEKNAPSFVAKQVMGMATEFVRLTRGGLPLIAEYKAEHNLECDMREYFFVE